MRVDRRCDLALSRIASSSSSSFADSDFLLVSVAAGGGSLVLDNVTFSDFGGGLDNDLQHRCNKRYGKKYFKTLKNAFLHPPPKKN